MKKPSLYILIAMWLWCSAAMGETLAITTQMVDEGNGMVMLTPPCNWDKNLQNVRISAVYAKPGNYTSIRDFSILDRESKELAPITPTTLEVVGTKLRIVLPEHIEEEKGEKYLYHLEADVQTTGHPCKSGFGFKF